METKDRFQTSLGSPCHLIQVRQILRPPEVLKPGMDLRQELYLSSLRGLLGISRLCHLINLNHRQVPSFLRKNRGTLFTFIFFILGHYGPPQRGYPNNNSPRPRTPQTPSGGSSGSPKPPMFDQGAGGPNPGGNPSQPNPGSSLAQLEQMVMPPGAKESPNSTSPMPPKTPQSPMQRGPQMSPQQWPNAPQGPPQQQQQQQPPPQGPPQQQPGPQQPPQPPQQQQQAQQQPPPQSQPQQPGSMGPRSKGPQQLRPGMMPPNMHPSMNMHPGM